MSKYEFKKIDTDTTQLIYKDKKFTIKRDVELTKDIQSVYAEAKLQMMEDLTKKGKTKNDYIIVRQENNKTYYDNSNLVELEQYYTNLKSIEIFNKLSEKYFNMPIDELISDIGLTTSEDAKIFGSDFANALKGEVKTPSEKIEEL